MQQAQEGHELAERLSTRFVPEAPFRVERDAPARAAAATSSRIFMTEDDEWKVPDAPRGLSGIHVP